MTDTKKPDIDLMPQNTNYSDAHPQKHFTYQGQGVEGDFSRMFDVRKLMPEGILAKFIRAMDTRSAYSCVPDNITTKTPEDDVKGIYDRMYTTIHLLALVPGLKNGEVLLPVIADDILSWVSRQWAYDSVPGRWSNEGWACRRHRYDVIAQLIVVLANQLSAMALLKMIRQHNLTSLVLPLYKTKTNTYDLVDLATLLAFHGKATLMTSWLMAGWEPVNVLETDEDLFGIKPRHNITRQLYDLDDPYNQGLYTFLERKGLPANYSDSIVIAKLDQFISMHSYTGHEHKAFRQRILINHLLIVKEWVLAHYYGDNQGKMLALLLVDELNTVPWLEWTAHYRPKSQNDIERLLSSAEEKQRGDLPVVLWSVLDHLVSHGLTDLLRQMRWLDNENGVHLVDIDNSQRTGKLVLNVATPEQHLIANLLAKQGNVFVVSPSAEEGLLNLHGG